MQQIAELASAVGLQIPSNGTENPIPPEAAEMVSQVIQQTETRDKRQDALVEALLPYLNPRRKQRLERAIKLSQFSRLAGFAMQNAPVFQHPTEEGAHV